MNIIECKNTSFLPFYLYFFITFAEIVYTMDIKEIIQKPIKAEFAQFVNYYSEQFKSDVPLLGCALAHVAGSTGKMMRPMLLLLAAKSCGNITASTYSAAAALELLHTASLLHDDVVDESDMRRGMPSLNALYSNRIAILTGDFLFSSSLYNASLTGNIDIIEGLSQLGRTLSRGEMLQLQLQRQGGFNEANYFEVIRCKTASLFSCCGRFGALSAGVSKECAAAFARFGEILGICFQIKDDIFDYFDTNIGKPTGSDIREGKVTLPALFVLEKSNDENVKIIKDKLNSGTTLEEEQIAYLIEQAKSKGGIEYALEKIEEFRREALEILPVDIPEDCRNAFISYLDYVISREK